MTFLADLQALVECESPSEDLSACHKVIELAQQIASAHLGVPATIHSEQGRPILWWGTKTPKVLVLAHLDTVWPIGSFTPTWLIEGDVLRGPGVFDMKAGFLQIIYALKDIPGAQEHVAILATTDEELGSQSSREFIKSASRNAQAVLVVESSLAGKVKTARKGTAMYRITAIGRAAHAGLEPEKGINATTEIARLALKMAELESVESGTTVTPTMMSSGTSTNTVPAAATLDIDIRSFADSDLVRVDQAIRNLKASHPEARLEISGGINRPPMEFKSAETLYEKLEKVAAGLGFEPIGHAAVGGASDGNFSASVGTPTLDGLGAVGGGAHARDEHILISSIHNRITLLTAFIKELIRV
ncbi:MAG: M20/M25/M40 family metallo-hydrolase [Actinomycetes bacterium]|jgi:glutamate carboxypeptidase